MARQAHRHLYIRIMPSLQSYAVRGNHYWRIVESYRDKHGHPRLRVLRHLGTVDKLLQLLSQAPGRPLCAEERDFGEITIRQAQVIPYQKITA